MESKRTKGTRIPVFLLACMCLAMFLGSAVHATPLFPWEHEDSVRALLTQQLQEGQNVSCRATVDRIAARNNPPYFVLRDEFRRAADDRDGKLIVLGRAPLGLQSGQSVFVSGTFGRLPSGEPCIRSATVEGFFDRQGQPLYWLPFFDFMTSASRQVLPVPTSPIPPSDPSLPNDGMGVSGDVSAFVTEGIARFNTVASLLSTAPQVLTPIDITCKPIKEVGEGFILVGDDNSDSVVKVYTNVAAKPGDRVLSVRGRVHSQFGSLVVYAGDGLEPFIDRQDGLLGATSVASPGTVAYVATLSDATQTSRSGGMGIMSGVSSTSSDGSWVYLTGQVVTYKGGYYSYALQNPLNPSLGIIGSTDVYNVEGLERRPGMRVWNPYYGYYGPSDVGSVVDIMAKVDTKDGQRTLGAWESDGLDAVNLSSTTHSVEAVILAARDYIDPDLPNVKPLGMNNRELGGPTFGNNPGVTQEPGSHGFYNVGDRVTVWGKVLETGYYQFDEYGYCTTQYMRIDDGAGVSTGDCTPSYGGPYSDKGVTVFGANTYPWYDQVSVGDYVLVTGASTIWKPSGTTNRYRCVWTTGDTQNPIYSVNGPVRETTSTGTISGTIKLYDIPTGLPNNQIQVKVYCSTGKGNVVDANNAVVPYLTVTRQTDGSGSASYKFTDVPKTVDVTVTDPYSGTYTYSENPQYLVSAQCDGYKTRTYTKVEPWTGTASPRNLYLTRLRKIYVMTNTTTLGSCSGGYYPSTTVITATVRDADHNPVQGVTVRFRTNKGSFASSGSLVHNYTATSPTNSNGQATATLYAVPSEWGYNDVVVEATDDTAPLTGDNLNDDTYNYDWQRLHDQYGQSGSSSGAYNITINPPSVDLQLTPDPIEGTVCETQKTITATLKVCGNGTSGNVHFETTVGTFSQSGTNTADVTANSSGQATVTLVRPQSCTFSEGDVTATGMVFPNTSEVLTTYPATVHVTWHGWRLKVTINPDLAVSGTSVSVKAKLTVDGGTTPVVGQSVVLTTNHGSFNPHDSGNSQRYTANTNSSGEISTTLIVSECPVTATVTGTTTTCTGGCTVTDNHNLEVVCQGTQIIDLVFAVDMTGSMGQSEAQARQNIAQLIDDLVAAGKRLRLAGIKFDDEVYDTKLPTGNVNDYKAWLSEDYPPERDGGLDGNENQLEALKRASEISPGSYIGLATDWGFHYWGDNNDPDSNNHSGADCPYTNLTAQQTRNLLLSANCKVYIDADAKYDSDNPPKLSWQHYTTPDVILHVNGEMESTSYGTYTFPKLKAAILQ